MRTARFFLPALFIAAFTVSRCNCGQKADEGGGSKIDGGPDGGPGTDAGGPGSTCLTNGNPCMTSAGGVCCSGNCSSGTCAQETFCKAPSAACSLNTECCSNHCISGTCSSQQCVDVGMACASNSDCCTFTCTSGSCAPISNTSSTCKVIGQACASGTDCCSTNCQGGVCVRAYSCQANGDICFVNSDCCGNACSSTDGGPGRCLIITGGGGGGCVQDGNPCADGTTCCSRVCVNGGAGATVCQPVGGCRLTGDYCTETPNCCGGAPNPNATVVCQASTSRCDNGQSCNGVGNICGHPLAPDGGPAMLPDGGVFTINASSNCCDGRTSVCKVDSSGVPRCFGGCPGGTCSGSCPLGYTGQQPCCIADGASCQLSGQCCDGRLCLPTDGGFACSAPTCKSVGAICTVGSTDCCPGTSCLLATNGNYVCQPQGGQSDGGSQCAANGSVCSSGTDCCSGICSGSVCHAPATCQPQTYSCTSTADCCSGLVCNILGGSTVGSCQPNSQGCAGLSQSCSTTRPCCAGTTCLSTSTFIPCTASDPSCACTVNIN